MNGIVWTKKAMKQFRQLDKGAVKTVRTAVQELVHWPDCRNVKHLQGRGDYRLRAGRYRIIFSIHDDSQVRIIRIEEVKKRDERTY